MIPEPPENYELLLGLLCLTLCLCYTYTLFKCSLVLFSPYKKIVILRNCIYSFPRKQIRLFTLPSVSLKNGVYIKKKKSGKRRSNYYHNNICRASLLSVFVERYDQNKSIQNLYGSLFGPYKACVQNGLTGSYMDAIFEFVAHEESEIWTSLPHSFTEADLLQIPAELWFRVSHYFQDRLAHDLSCPA